MRRLSNLVPPGSTDTTGSSHEARQAQHSSIHRRQSRCSLQIQAGQALSPDKFLNMCWNTRDVTEDSVLMYSLRLSIQNRQARYFCQTDINGRLKGSYMGLNHETIKRQKHSQWQVPEKRKWTFLWISGLRPPSSQ